MGASELSSGWERKRGEERGEEQEREGVGGLRTLDSEMGGVQAGRVASIFGRDVFYFVGAIDDSRGMYFV